MGLASLFLTAAQTGTTFINTNGAPMQNSKTERRNPMPRYRLTPDPDVMIRLAPDWAVIPRGHRWWDDYEAWLREGHTPEPAEPNPPYRPVPPIKRNKTSPFKSENPALLTTGGVFCF